MINITLLKKTFQSYADEGHELRGVLEHVYRSMQEFFEECLSLDSDESSKDREADTWRLANRLLFYHRFMAFLRLQT